MKLFFPPRKAPGPALWSLVAFCGGGRYSGQGDGMNRVEPVHCAWSQETVHEEWAAPYESHVPPRASTTGRPRVSTNGSLDIVRHQFPPLTRVCTWKRKRGHHPSSDQRVWWPRLRFGLVWTLRAASLRADRASQ